MDAARRDRAVLRVLWIVLVLNFVVAAIKIIVGFATDRLAVIGDGFHSLLDGANNVIGIVAITLSARPADDEHPYGHRKFENVAAMAIGAMIVLIAWEIGDNIIRTVYRHLSGQAKHEALAAVDLWTVGIVASTLFINLFVAIYETRKGRALQSPFLVADSAHTLSDSMVTGLSLTSLLVAGFAWWIDPLIATGVLVFLLIAAWKILKYNVSAFTDRVFLDPDTVRHLVENISGVESTSRIRSHGTENDIHLDLKIRVDETLTAREVEQIERAVRRALRDQYPNLTLIGIHHETQQQD